MAYAAKTDWKIGDRLTAEELNRIEAGVAEAHAAVNAKASTESVSALAERVAALETPAEG